MSLLQRPLLLKLVAWWSPPPPAAHRPLPAAPSRAPSCESAASVCVPPLRAHHARRSDRHNPYGLMITSSFLSFEADLGSKNFGLFLTSSPVLPLPGFPLLLAPAVQVFRVVITLRCNQGTGPGWPCHLFHDHRYSLGRASSLPPSRDQRRSEISLFYFSFFFGSLSKKPIPKVEASRFGTQRSNSILGLRRCQGLLHFPRPPHRKAVGVRQVPPLTSLREKCVNRGENPRNAPLTLVSSGCGLREKHQRTWT